MKTLTKKNKFLNAFFGTWLVLFFSLAIVTQTAQAQIKQNPPASQTPTSPQNVPGGAGESIAKLLCAPDDSGTVDSKQGIYTCVNNGYKIVIVLGSLGAVFWIIVAGYLYMASDGSQESVTKAKEILVSTVAGMFIILMTFVFLKQLNPELVRFPAIDLQTIALNPGGTLLSPFDECMLRYSGNKPLQDQYCSGLSHDVPGGGTSGVAAECTGGLIDTPTDIPRVKKASTEKICKDLATKLQQLARIQPKGWVVFSMIRDGGADSSCHYSGKPSTGNCADISLSSGNAVDAPGYKALCSAIAQVGGINFANEASHAPECEAIKPYKKESQTSGANLHVNFLRASGSGTTTSSNNNPNNCGKPDIILYPEGSPCSIWQNAHCTMTNGTATCK